MKILHIVAGNLDNGAARGAYWLHKALLREGVESRIFTNSAMTFSDDSVTSTVNSDIDRVISVVRSRLDRMPFSFYKRGIKGFSSGMVGTDFTDSEEYEDADIIHLHWINGGFVNLSDLKKVDKPIVWTLRDMWPFTGGCHYSMECDRFRDGCGRCPRLGSEREYDISRFILSRKMKVLPKSIYPVGISRWISRQAEESSLFRNFDISTIENAIDTDLFFPIDKRIARSVLGIDSDKKILLTGAKSIDAFYKGFDLFIEALRYLPKERYLLCFFGELDKSVVDKTGFEYMDFGYLHDSISLRLAYSCADIFVAPSRMEAFGKTIAESMACGTPVVCFDATGPADIVRHEKDGYLAKPFAPDSLAEGIEWIAMSDRADEIGLSASKRAGEHYSGERAAREYISLYDRIMEERSRWIEL